MSRQFWTDFLELYMSFPCLWKVTEDSYRNRDSRSAAMNEMLKKLNEVEPLADLKALAKKINSYRTTFRTVHKRYNISCKSGASADDVEEPTLWYYKILLPTVVTHGSSRQSKNTLDDSFFDEINEDGEESRPMMSSSCLDETQPTVDDDNTFFEAPDMDEFAGSNITKCGNVIEPAGSKKAQMSKDPNVPTSSMTVQKQITKNNGLSKPKKKKKLEDLLEIACEVLTRPDPPVIPNRFAAVATNVSAILEELNQSNPTQCILAEKLINDVLVQGRFGQLTLNTCIAEVTENL